MATPFAGNPTLDPSSVTIPDDGIDPPDFITIEAPVQGNRNSIASLRARKTEAAINWRNSFAATGPFGAGASLMQAAAWDPLRLIWVLAGFDAGGAQSVISVGPGADDGNANYWTVFSGLSVGTFNQGAVCADPVPSNSRWWLVTCTHTTLLAETMTLGGSDTLQRTVGSKTALQNVQLITYGGQLIYAVGSASVAAEVTISTASASAPTVWSDFAVGAAVHDWILKTDATLLSGGTLVLAVPYNQTGSAYSSPDGTTWTTTALSTYFGIGASDVVLGLTWNPVASLWYAFVKTAGGPPKVLTSATGISGAWSAITMVTTATLTIADLAALGTYLVAVLAEVSTLGSRYIFSPDQGKTWYFAQASTASNQSTAGATYRRPQIAQGEIGLLGWNGNWLRVSHLVGALGQRI